METIERKKERNIYLMFTGICWLNINSRILQMLIEWGCLTEFLRNTHVPLRHKYRHVICMSTNKFEPHEQKSYRSKWIKYNSQFPVKCKMSNEKANWTTTWLKFETLSTHSPFWYSPLIRDGELYIDSYSLFNHNERENDAGLLKQGNWIIMGDSKQEVGD